MTLLAALKTFNAEKGGLGFSDEVVQPFITT